MINNGEIESGHYFHTKLPPPCATLKGKQISKLLLSAAILLFLAAVFVSPVAAHTINDHSSSEWIEWNTNNALPTTSGSYYLTTDVTLDSSWDVPAGETNLCLNGYVISLSDESTAYSVIKINTPTSQVGAISKKLTTYDCGDTPHYFTISEDGYWRLTDTEDENTQTLNGGIIAGKYLDASTSMYVIEVRKSSLEINGGSIIGGRCGVYLYDGSFVMNVGNISGNEEGIRALHSSSLTMNDGVVSHNTKYGVYMLSNPSFTMNGGFITENLGTGVYGGVFTMKNGHITKNRGGVRVTGETFTLENGEISANEGYAGVGVYVVSGNFIMEGGKIIGNTATGFVESDGTYISSHGAGISVSDTASIFLRGGTIQGNIADSGSGISFHGDEFIISSPMIIDADNDVYIDDKHITVTGDTPFTSSVLHISWNGNNIKTGHDLVRVTSTAFTASDIKPQFVVIKNGYALLPSADNKNLTVVGLPTVDKTTVSISPYNSTIANVSFKLTDRNDATSVYVNLTNTTDTTDKKSVCVTKSIPAGTGLTDIQISGLTPKQTYTLTITPLNSAIAAEYIYTHPELYTSPDKLTISTISIPSGTLNTPYSFTFTKEGEDTAVWALKEGDSLPNGLTLNSNGVIQGTPTKVETKTFNVTVASRGETDTKEFALTIEENSDSTTYTPSTPQGSSIWLTETQTPTETPTQTEPTEITQPTQPNDKDNDDDFPLAGIIGGVVLLLIVVGLGVFLVTRRR